ncbi:MAG: B12-binding domain-containing radical SAM protein [Candidatus Jordarchaeum sp.]|uniref:B12-binding domain-containing radical SAM protein n=1 Tax=Candidatus Jordarchaeum sp. TaxID=2823881 RepID=UPI0040498C4A
MSGASFVIVDALASERGFKRFTRDVIGSGPRTVAGVLEQLGFECRISTSEQVFRDSAFLSDFDVLMCSGMTVDIPSMRKIVDLWRRVNGDRVSIAGGPAAADPYFLLRKTGFDLLVISECEETLKELLGTALNEGKMPAVDELRSIRGLAFRAEDGVEVTPLRPPAFVFWFEPSVDRVVDYPYFRVSRVYVTCVRGCSNYRRTLLTLPDGRKCNQCGLCAVDNLTERYYCPEGILPGCGFCSVPSLFGPPRSRSEESILREIDRLLKIGVNRIVLGASDFLDFQREKLVSPHPLTDPCLPEPNYAEIESLLYEIKKLQYKIEVRTYVSIENVKPCLFTEEAAQIISNYLPKTTVHIGCETGSEQHSRNVGRPSTPNESLMAVKLAVTYGLRPYVYFIHGLPGQTMDTAKETVEIMDKMAKLGAEKITIYRFKPLPMSAFGDFKTPPPATKNKFSKMILDKAKQINLEIKKSMIGKTVEAAVAEKIKPGEYIAYPLEEGPTILLRAETASQNESVKVKISKIKSEKLVEAVLV